MRTRHVDCGGTEMSGGVKIMRCADLSAIELKCRFYLDASRSNTAGVLLLYYIPKIPAAQEHNENTFKQQSPIQTVY